MFLKKNALGRSAERALGGRVLAGEVVQHAEHAVHLDVVALGRDLLDHLVRGRSDRGAPRTDY